MYFLSELNIILFLFTIPYTEKSICSEGLTCLYKLKDQLQLASMPAPSTTRSAAE
ncbi:hypothetical protein DSUL_50068 [Desulfovibrionales bacterium]